MARDEQVRIDLVADDKASKVVKDLAGKVEELEDAEVEIPITADADQAERAIEELADEAGALSKQDAEIVLRAKIDDARGELKALRDDLDQTGEKADQTARQLDRVDGDGGHGGLKTRGNAIADLTGPLGEASGAASDFAGVFDGLGDIVEDAAGKMGASASSAAAISGAVGGVGIAVAGAAALWSLYTSKQKAAREEQEKLIAGQKKLNDALAEGNTTAAADTITELYKDQYDAAHKAGIGAEEFTRYLTGATDALPALNAQLRALNDEQTRNGDSSSAANQKIDEQRLTLINLIATLTAARDGYIETNGTLVEHEARQEAVIAALEGHKVAQDDATLAAMEGATAYDRATGATGKNTGATDLNTTSQGRNRAAVDQTKAGFDQLRGALNMDVAMQQFSATFQTAMDAASDDSADTNADILALKGAILDVAEYANLTPIQVQSMLKAVENGDIAGVRTMVEDAYRRSPVRLATQLLPPKGAGAGGGQSGTGPVPVMAPPGGGGDVSVVNVTQYLPRGYRERDTLAAASAAARRSGGLYRRARR